MAFDHKGQRRRRPWATNEVTPWTPPVSMKDWTKALINAAFTRRKHHMGPPQAPMSTRQLARSLGFANPTEARRHAAELAKQAEQAAQPTKEKEV